MILCRQLVLITLFLKKARYTGRYKESGEARTRSKLSDRPEQLIIPYSDGQTA